jgi:hypothetical protein
VLVDGDVVKVELHPGTVDPEEPVVPLDVGEEVHDELLGA